MTKDTSKTNDPADQIRDALRPRIRKLLKDMWAHEEGVRTFEHPESVHQMRVSSRKVRAALDSAGDLFGGKKYRPVRKGVRRLTRALGGVRDGDVLLIDLERLRTAAGDGAHPGIDRLIARVEHDREEERERLLATLDELDADGFRETSLTAFEGKTGTSIADLRRRDARHMVEGHISEFADLTETIPPEEDAHTLHEIRIATKQLRYAVQLFGKPLAPESEPVIEALTDMQDQLGEIHNLDVLIGLIRDELQVIADEEIEHATGHTAPREDTQSIRNDLLALVSRVAIERHGRYERFVRWWDELQSGTFPDSLRALTSGRKSDQTGTGQ